MESSYMKNKTILFFFLMWSSLYALSVGEDFPLRRNKLITIANGLPSNNVLKLYQDKTGYIWIATRDGLCKYDGHIIRTYRSDLHTPNLLTNNNIFCVGEDDNNRLWIGTYQGLNVLDKTTGKIQKINHPELTNNSICQILITQQKNILLATERGLYQYIPEKDSCILFSEQNTGGELPATSIKALLEDSKGNVWIGTWNRGLYRYDPSANKYYTYPQFNSRNSAHTILEDSKQRIWIGTWDCGLFLLENAWEPERLSWKTYEHIPNKPASLISNIIYDIKEDIHTHSLWVGTPEGLSILKEGEDDFFNYSTDESGHFSTLTEVNSIIRDRQGIMWLGMLGGGVCCIDTRPSHFKPDELPRIRHTLKSNEVASLYAENDSLIWLGIKSKELVIYNRHSGKDTYTSQLDEFKKTGCPTSVLTIKYLPATQKIWIGTFSGGLYSFDRQAPTGNQVKRYLPEDTEWLPHHCVYDILEDSKGSRWLATKNGIGMVTKEGTVVPINQLKIGGRDLRNVVVNALAEGLPGEIWAATENYGILRITGRGTDVAGYALENYSFENGKLNTMNACCLFSDEQERLWAGSNGGGLNLYNREDNKFETVHKQWNLPGDVVSSILGDENGVLWLGSNSGLIRLSTGEDLSAPAFCLYTAADGLSSHIFTRNAAFMTSRGEMLFGTNDGYNSFYPTSLSKSQWFPPVVITDIKIFNRSWETLDEESRNKISELMPEFARQITLDHRHDNFSIEFAALDYTSSVNNNYAYRLDGFNSAWQYTNARQRAAYYNNLRPGRYTFRVKSTNSNGIWGENEATLDVLVLSPLWKTRWAYALYALLAAGIAAATYRATRKRRKQLLPSLPSEHIPEQIATSTEPSGCETPSHDMKKQLIFEIKDINYTKRDKDFLQQAIDCIYAHLDDGEFDQTRFAEEMGMSKSSLFRKLKTLTGLNYASFNRNIRLKAACKLMDENHEIRISDLAYAVGFNDPKYFSACFKKEFGLLPSEYIEKLKEDLFFN